MHPDVMRELANQHNREVGARAREARLARRIRRETRGRAAAAAGYVLPRIPDYADSRFGDMELAGRGARPDGERPGLRRAAGRRAA